VEIARGCGRVIRMFFNYGMKQAWKLMSAAQNDYDYNMRAMIRDSSEGKFPRRSCCAWL